MTLKYLKSSICKLFKNVLGLRFIYKKINQLENERNLAFLDADFFERTASMAKEREKTNMELLNRLTRENARLQERIGNLESLNQIIKTRNQQYESQMDEANWRK